MSSSPPRRNFEQHEVIEHVVTETRRPVVSMATGPLKRETGYRETTETITFGGNGSGRGSSSSLRQPGITPPRVASFQQLTGYSPPNIGKYGGYDMVEVHTPAGATRMVESHAEATFESRISAVPPPPPVVDSPSRRPGITSILKSGLLSSFRSSSRTSIKRGEQQPTGSTPPIFTVPHLSRSDSWRRVTGSNEDASSGGSLARQGSYKRMQQKQEAENLQEGAQVYAPRSDTSLVSATHRQNRSIVTGHSHGDTLREKAEYWWAKVQDRFRNTPRSRRLTANLLLLGLFAVLLLILLIIILRAIFASYSVRTLLLYPPPCEECRRRNPDMITQSASTLYVHYNSRAQVHFELVGSAPFKSNSFTAVDFDTGYVAYADHALSDPNGRHSTCFLMALDPAAIPSMDALNDALGSVRTEIHSQFGWQEYWQFQTEPMDANSAQRKFTDKIRGCDGARWYFLKPTVYTRDGSCGDCYDFCLPDYGIQRLKKYNDEMTIGIRRLNCFRLYIPEWAQYSVNSDSTGGHWQYPNRIGNQFATSGNTQQQQQQNTDHSTINNIFKKFRR